MKEQSKKKLKSDYSNMLERYYLELKQQQISSQIPIPTKYNINEWILHILLVDRNSKAPSIETFEISA